MKTIPSAFKYLVWPGLMLLTAGLVVGALNGWTGIAVGLLVVGVIAIVGAIASGSYSGFWQQRSTMAGTNALASVLSVILILGLINFLATSYTWRKDLTAGQLLSLSPASQEVVKSLEQPTELILFSQLPNPTEKKLLEDYRRYNSDFTYRYVDPNTDPQLASQFNLKTGTEAFLKAGEKTITVPRPSPEAPIEERTLTNKLALLSQDQSAVAYFLQGHGEYDLLGAQQGYYEAATRLQEQNYTVTPLNLAETNTIPSDADVLIVGGPKQALFDSEVTAIKNYLNAGGSLFLLEDPQVKTGLEAVLEPWGIVLEDAIVIDVSGGGQLVGLGPAAPLVTEYGSHPITEAFGNSRSFYPVARPIKIIPKDSVQAFPLLFTAPQSLAQPVAAGEELAVDPNREPQGPLVIGAAFTRSAETAENNASEKTASTAQAEQPADKAANQDTNTTTEAEAKDAKAEDTELKDLPLAEESDAESNGQADLESSDESRLVVIGNSSFAVDGYFDQQLNGDVFLNSVNWLSKIDSPTLSIQPKEIANRRFEMTVQQQIFLTLLALVVFPLAGLVGAGVLWARRR